MLKYKLNDDLPPDFVEHDLNHLRGQRSDYNPSVELVIEYNKPIPEFDSPRDTPNEIIIPLYAPDDDVIRISM